MKLDQEKTIDFIRELVFSYKFHQIGLPTPPLFAFQPFSKSKDRFIIFEDMGAGILWDSITPPVQIPPPPFEDYDADHPFDLPIATTTCDLDDTKKMIIFYGITFALSIIHQFDIIFRILSMKYILLNEDGEPFLAGSDFARVLHEHETQSSGSNGHPPYVCHLNELKIKMFVSRQISILWGGVLMSHLISD